MAISEISIVYQSRWKIRQQVWKQIIVRLSADTVDEAIEAAMARCKSKDVPMLWRTGPATQPADLGERLAERGFQTMESPSMAADLNVFPKKQQLLQDLVTERIEDEEKFRK
jgi:hypothetical protein